MGSLRVKIKLTVTVRQGSKVKYNEGKYKLTNYIECLDKGHLADRGQFQTGDQLWGERVEHFNIIAL